MQSCVSPAFNIMTVEKLGLSEFARERKTFEAALLPPEGREPCGEWQSVQPTSLRQCSPRR